MTEITHTYMRDMNGAFLWADPFEEPLYSIGQRFTIDGITYEVKRMALVENIQHVNLAVIEEDIIITEPYL